MSLRITMILVMVVIVILKAMDSKLSYHCFWMGKSYVQTKVWFDICYLDSAPMRQMVEKGLPDVKRSHTNAVHLTRVSKMKLHDIADILKISNERVIFYKNSNPWESSFQNAFAHSELKTTAYRLLFGAISVTWNGLFPTVCNNRETWIHHFISESHRQ